MSVLCIQLLWRQAAEHIIKADSVRRIWMVSEPDRTVWELGTWSLQVYHCTGHLSNVALGRICTPNMPCHVVSWPNFVRSQVIYKKTQLPCPLPFFYHNSNLSMNGSGMPELYALQNHSAHFSRADVSPAAPGSHDAHHSTGVHFGPHPDDEEMCTPKYFVFNSQVCWSIS